MKESVILSPGVVLDETIIKEYYEAVRFGTFDDFYPMEVFKKKYPSQCRHLEAVHRRRVVIRESLEAMKIISEKVYFGTLTFNNEKNENKVKTKRREAFMKLNELFEYVLLVEEYGHDNGRYHIHFLGVFKLDHDFESFKTVWNHSRQELRLVKTHEKVAQYLCKYLVKDLPRIRRNKKMVALAREYHKAKSIQRYFKDVKEFDPEVRCRNYHFISILDEV